MGRKKKVHYIVCRDYRWHNISACGLTEPRFFTHDIKSKVTCLRCLKAMGKEITDESNP